MDEDSSPRAKDYHDDERFDSSHDPSHENVLLTSTNSKIKSNVCSTPSSIYSDLEDITNIVRLLAILEHRLSLFQEYGYKHVWK